MVAVRIPLPRGVAHPHRSQSLAATPMCDFFNAHFCATLYAR
jgi:hypothetical protein